jgi:hypothetical protein
MSTRRVAWSILGLACACERAPTRLERASQQIEARASDEDLARGRAALQEPKPRSIAPPEQSKAERVRLSLTVTAADGELDERAAAAIRARLERLRLGGQVERVGGALSIAIEEAPQQRVPVVASAIGAQGRVQVARLDSARRREELRVDDPALGWTSLAVARVEAAEPVQLPALTLVLTADGGAALARTTGRGGFMALAFDDVVLSVPRIDSPVSGGRLTVTDLQQEIRDPRGSIVVLAAALASPAPEPWTAELAAIEEASACAGPPDCEAGCARGNGQACLRVAEGLAEGAEQVEALAAACAVGSDEGCTRLCTGADTSRCKAAIATLSEVGSVWQDLRHAGTLAVELCRKGDLEACTTATAALVFGALGPGEFVAADAMLREIRDEAKLVQATAIRQLVLDQAREICRGAEARELAVKACLFVAQAHAGGVLAPRDARTEEEALRRAGRLLRER